MRARKPLASVIRIAARPVGAASSTRAPWPRGERGDRLDRCRLARSRAAGDQRQPVRECVAHAGELLGGQLRDRRSPSARARAVDRPLGSARLRARATRCGELRLELGGLRGGRSSRSSRTRSPVVAQAGRSGPRPARCAEQLAQRGEQRGERHAGAAAALGLREQVQRRRRGRARGCRAGRRPRARSGRRAGSRRRTRSSARRGARDDPVGRAAVARRGSAPPGNRGRAARAAGAAGASPAGRAHELGRRRRPGRGAVRPRRTPPRGRDRSHRARLAMP